MKLCIEGPSAVGKTTLCNALESNIGAYILEETIIRHIEGLSPFEEAIYNLNQELDRWQIANDMSEKYRYLVFDTDPLKSLWFNWSLGFKECMDLFELDVFFHKALSSNK